jgi:hypothetical protein
MDPRNPHRHHVLLSVGRSLAGQTRLEVYAAYQLTLWSGYALTRAAVHAQSEAATRRRW